MDDLDKAHNLLDSFEKKSAKHVGVDDLSNALYILSAILNPDQENQFKRKANNLISTNRTFILSRIHSLLDNPVTHTYHEFDYWCRILQEYFDYGLVNNELLFIEQELLKHREQSRWDSLTENQKIKELISKIKQLSKEQREKVFAFVEEALNKKKIQIKE